MKKIITFLLIFLSLPGLAQTDSVIVEDQIAGTPYDASNRAFEQLNLSILSTGNLIDKASWIGQPDWYKGNPSTDSLADANSWKNVYKALRFSCATCESKPDTFSIIQQTIDGFLQNDILPIGVIYYDYDAIKENAFTDDLLGFDTVNYYLYDKPRNVSPYQVNTTFLASPLELEIKSLSTKFIIPSNLFIQNKNVSGYSFYADFDDGAGFQYIKTGIAYQVNYIDGGLKKIKVQLITPDDTLTSVSNLKVNGGFDVLGFTAKDYSVNARVGGGTVTGTTYTSLGCDGVLDKPIIVIEGFDNSNTIELEHILGNYGFSKFQNQVDHWGYDIIIVNLGDATTYIENNAGLLRAVINDVNYMKEQAGSRQELIIVGASMGGLIARYELALMEKEGLHHKTKLYVSYDSPHNGAYVPLGLQYLMDCTKEFGIIGTIFDKNNDLFVNYNALKSPAARQMLIRHFQPGPDHINFYSALNLNGLPNSKGFPVKCRNIAMVDGSNLGTPQAGLNANDEILNFENKSWNWSTLLFKVRGRVSALPDNTQGVREICYYSYAHRVGLFRFPLELKIFKLASNVSWERVPGGYEDIQAEVLQGLTSQSVVKFEATTNGRDNSAFVPSFSGAALNTTDPYFDFQNNDIYSSKITPFDFVYSKNNQNISNNGSHVLYKSFYLYYLNNTNMTSSSMLQNIELQVNDLYLQDKRTEYDVDYEASLSITAGNNVIPSGINNNFQAGDFIVASGTETLFKAKSTIELLPGFEVEYGAGFDTRLHSSSTPLCDPNFRLAYEGQLGATSPNTEELPSSSYEEVKKEVIIYPNPASSLVVAKFLKDNELKFKVYLYSSTGVLLKELSGTGEVSFSTESLKPGVYYVKVSAGNNIMLEKLMIQK